MNGGALTGRELKHVSPLRYPGGKAALAELLAETIKQNGLSSPAFFEPFAGGAGAALRLLSDDVVSEVHLNDLDPRVAAFWKAVLDESDRFAKKILTVPVTVEEWRRQSEVCRRADVSKPFELGFAAFYLNRCNRSGVIIGAAPIGGYAQDGEWKIDARFYRETLAERVRALGRMRERIRVTEMDARDFLIDHLPRGRARERVFVYLDPPYHGKGSRLYLDSYRDGDHERLAKYLEGQKRLKWIASYDDSPFIRELYGSCNISGSSLRYSLQRNRRAQELLISPTYLQRPGERGSTGELATFRLGGNLMESGMTEMVRGAELAFDIENPRLSEFELGNSPSDSEVIEVLWGAMDVREVMLSIAASGYFQHEPLIVAQEGGKNVVIEGNRRLAAVRILLDPTLVEATDIPAVGKDAKKALQQLPIIASNRKDAWQYIGFKHVNGPAKWSSYAKSRYITKVHREFGVGLEDIAKQIGDTHKTVQRLFRGMMVIEQAEGWKVFNREDRSRRHFSFSHLYTGLDYTGISEFIGLSPEADEDPEPVPAEKKEALGELCLWLYGSKKEETRPIVQSQNPDLRRLNDVVANREAVAALRAGTELSYAFEISRPSANVFEESLHAAKRELGKARSMLSTGYDGSPQLLVVAEDVADLAEDLYAEMERKSSPRRRRRAGADD